MKNIVKPRRKEINEEELEKAIKEKVKGLDPKSEVKENESETNEKDEPKKSTNKEDKQEDELTNDQKALLQDILKTVKNKISRGEYSEAKAKIIEGLSIDKFNKDLNIYLASIYEKDKDYKKVELIYKDLIVLNDHDTEIYLKLGFILSVQSKYEVAYEIYKKLYSIDKNNIEAVEMLANISHHLGNFEESKDYAKIFLKKKPKNTDILFLQASNYINLGNRKEALEHLLKLRQIEPYNVKVNDIIEKIKLEIELETNFNNQDKK